MAALVRGGLQPRGPKYVPGTPTNSGSPIEELGRIRRAPASAASDSRAMAGRSPPKPRGITVRAVRPEDWAEIELLFGSNGACGGCWCMWWRVPTGGAAWERVKGEPNRRALRELVERGEVHALLARDGAEVVGWCSLGPRGDFPRAERVKAIRGDWDRRTWSVTCFFIPARHRGRGVATALLRAAIEHARRRGAAVLDG
jgi:predicted GNAT family acetyltransferase